MRCAHAAWQHSNVALMQRGMHSNTSPHLRKEFASNHGTAVGRPRARSALSWSSPSPTACRVQAGGGPHGACAGLRVVHTVHPCSHRSVGLARGASGPRSEGGGGQCVEVFTLRGARRGPSVCAPHFLRSDGVKLKAVCCWGWARGSPMWAPKRGRSAPGKGLVHIPRGDPRVATAGHRCSSSLAIRPCPRTGNLAELCPLNHCIAKSSVDAKA